MASYTISDLKTPVAKLEQYYRDAKRSHRFDFSELDQVFQIVMVHRDRFPGINIPAHPTIAEYISRWVASYVMAKNSLPSTRISSPKSACSDPAVKKIVQTTQAISVEEANQQEKHHNLFMSAENIQGNLLEEYIAECVKPYGWIWCTGNILRAVDFCNSDGSYLLQVKNKSNTENSSSSNIREGTSIEKWYRLGTRTLSGKKVPDYKWSVLVRIISDHRTQGEKLPDCLLCEQEYHRFLYRVAMTNKALITEQ